MSDKLQDAWSTRFSLRAEGCKLWAEGCKLWAEGDKRWAESDKLWAEGDIVWLTAVIEAHGNVEVRWDAGDCIVEGVRYSAREAQEAGDAQ